MKGEIILGLACACLLAGFLVYDALDKEEAMVYNEEVVRELRKEETEDLNRFMSAVSVLVTSNFIMPLILVAYYLCKHKLNGLSNIIFIIISIYLNSILKLAFNEGRPYFFFPSINIIGKCERGFGHPSGHAMVGLIAAFVFMDWFIEEISMKPRVDARDIEYSTVDSHEEKPRLGPKAWGVYLVGIAIVFTIGLSRVYLGAHSYQQVLSGWAYGALYLILHYLWLKREIRKTLKSIGHSKEIFNKGKTHSLIIIIFATAIAFVIPIITYEATKNEAKKAQFAALIKANCGSESFRMLDVESLTGAGLLGLAFGVYIGAYFSKGTAAAKITGKSGLSLGQSTLRFLSMLIVVGVAGAGLALMELTEMPYLIYTVGAFLNFGLAGFNLVYLLPIAFYKISLTYEGDFMRILPEI